jgi:hypothetical protein
MYHTSFLRSLWNTGWLIVEIVLKLVVLAISLIPTWFWLIIHAIPALQLKWHYFGAAGHPFDTAVALFATLCAMQLGLLIWAASVICCRWWR